MYYETHGEGVPLLLIHGSTLDVNGWSHQIRDFSKRYRVIAFDNRGTGRTTSPKPPYTIEEMAEDTARLMDALGVEKAHVLGFSMGGFIAQELAIRYPGRVKSLVAAGSSAWMGDLGRARTRLFLDMLKAGLSPELAFRNFYLWFFSEKFFDNVENVKAALNANFNNPHPQPLDGLFGQGEAIIGFDSRLRAGSITAPTLVISAKEDILIPPRLSEELSRLIPGSKLKHIGGCCHAMIFEDPQAFNGAVLDFLDG